MQAIWRWPAYFLEFVLSLKNTIKRMKEVLQFFHTTIIFILAKMLI